MSSLASLQLHSDHLFVSDRQTSHRQLRPVTLMASCFGRHVGLLEDLTLIRVTVHVSLRNVHVMFVVLGKLRPPFVGWTSFLSYV